MTTSHYLENINFAYRNLPDRPNLSQKVVRAFEKSVGMPFIVQHYKTSNEEFREVDILQMQAMWWINPVFKPMIIRRKYLMKVENRKLSSGTNLLSVLLFIPFFMLMSILLSCKDEVTEVEKKIITYPVVYTSIPVKDYVIRAYTRDGEIMDSATMNYINKKYGYLLAGKNNYDSNGEVVISYLSSGKVEFRKLNPSMLDTLTVLKKGDLIYLEKKDTVILPYSFEYELYFFKNMFRYKPLYYEEIPVPLSSGYSKAAKYKPWLTVETAKDTLILPMLDLIYKLHDSYNYLPEINNELCTDSLHNLYGNGYDTLIIREYSIRLKKQTQDLKL